MRVTNSFAWINQVKVSTFYGSKNDGFPFNSLLDLQQDRRLPTIQLGDLIIFNDASCKRLLIIGLDSVDDRVDKFTLAGGCECRVL